MKRSLFVLTAALAVFGLGACGPASRGAVDAAHNSRNSVNWEGVYEGTIPAADGPGIDVRVTLNTDETYEVRYDYIGKEGGFTTTGRFAWNKDGDTITLDARDIPPYYKVGEGILIHLDMEGKVITGDLADLYVLRKVPPEEDQGPAEKSL
ncbi:MAG: copper resistance protein NlpE [Treponema sp.]|jgi:uncharacterized lipoprotein NlpE involved in copper resistance|nr:copper resistance protein NlpE [Treponema sp.]